MTQPGGQVVPRDQLGDIERRAPGTTTADLSRVSVNLRQPLADLDQAYRLAVMLAQSNLVPKALQGSPQNTLIVIMTGLELDLTVTQALRSVYVAKNGMPGLRGEMLLGKLRQAGHDYDYSEPVPEGCVFRLHRNHEAPLAGFAQEQCGQGRDYFGSFTQDDALRARLLTRDKEGNLVARSQYGEPMPHESYAPDMMFWRAAARAIRRGAPEITLGFTIAELDDDNQPPGPKLPVTANGGGLAVQGVEAHVQQLERERELRQIEHDMTPAAGGDTRSRPADAAAAGVNADQADRAAGDTGSGVSTAREQDDPRAAGAAPSRGAQPPPPQAPAIPPGSMPTLDDGTPDLSQPAMFAGDPRSLLGLQEGEPLIDPDCKAGKHRSCPGGPCECREGEHFSGHGLPVPAADPTPARSAGTPKAATSRGSSTAAPAAPGSGFLADLAARFDQMGWAWNRHKASVLDAVAQYVRRPVTGLDELTMHEAEGLARDLGGLMKRHEEEHWPVALADEVEKWREHWRKADTDGYAKAHPG